MCDGMMHVVHFTRVRNTERESADCLCYRSGAEEESAPDGNVVVARLMGGVEYGRPLATGWTGTLGVNWQRAKCLNEHGNCITQVQAILVH